MVNYKPSGSTGAIYIIHHANNTPNVDATPFVDLNALFGANPHTATNNYVPDVSAYDAVGKTGLGGMALSDDESTLYVMNLADRNLYGIPIWSSTQRANNTCSRGYYPHPHTFPCGLPEQQRYTPLCRHRLPGPDLRRRCLLG
ncbi:MAG: hypothetical protein M3Y39_18195 [Chloroflexota bacterium]|nr:hypothetical protein [Chloroflexota bacterium]